MKTLKQMVFDACRGSQKRIDADLEVAMGQRFGLAISAEKAKSWTAELNSTCPRCDRALIDFSALVGTENPLRCYRCED